jgi:hypothetical protein
MHSSRRRRHHVLCAAPGQCEQGPGCARKGNVWRAPGTTRIAVFLVKPTLSRTTVSGFQSHYFRKLSTL